MSLKKLCVVWLKACSTPEAVTCWWIMSASSESVFEVYYLGMVQNVDLGTNLSQKADVLLVDKVEEAQVSWLLFQDKYVLVEYKKT